ncbi:MAG: helix-turn-helix transcriptional regulator [Gemmatimonadetes bacterium]|nr:helix-turn-helix transcriptional regulator [Gemmatimonadota bacterium]
MKEESLIGGGQIDLLLLASLRRRRLHGYGIIQELRSDGRFELPEGTVYPALYRLERLGLIRSRTEIVGGRQRRVYELTVPGHRAVTERRKSWRRLVAGMDAVLGRA